MHTKEKRLMLAALVCLSSVWNCQPTEGAPSAVSEGWVLVPSGEFEMGDHHDLGGREHRSDEVPIHVVHVDAFHMAATEVTNAEYCRFLNAVAKEKSIAVRDGLVYADDGSTLYCDTLGSDAASSLRWDGARFALVGNRENHPVVCVRWHGGAAYCNWLSTVNGYEPCYDRSTWRCDYSRNGFRLPTEAEWEYAARGGQHGTYRIFPWGDDPDPSKANWPNSGDPYETGPYPWTTPAGFYNGALHKKHDLKWPAPKKQYQTSNGANGYGLYDMSGNVWEWVNDWYRRDYYARSPGGNPSGPDSGQPMRDGKPYRVLRSGNWYNGEWGHGRAANRDPSYYRGPDDPNHRWYHVGFRVVRPGPGATGKMDVGVAKTVSATYEKRDEPRQRAGQGRQRRGNRQQPRGDKFQGTDSNGDGAVSLDEYLFHETTKFGRIDVDRDKVISPSEMEADERQQRESESRGRSNRFESADSNRDGSVSLDEYLAGERGKFQRRDTSGDGLLSKRELEAGQPSPQNRTQQGRPSSKRYETNSRQPEQRARRGGRGSRQEAEQNITALSEGKLGLVSATQQAAPGYTLFAPKHRTMTYLIDNRGQVVHEWTESQFEPGQAVYLLKNGNLLRCCFTHARGFTRGGEGGRIEEYDWDGNLVWEFDYASHVHMLHHDIAVLPNGNILALAVERKSLDECVAAGFDPRLIRDNELYPDYVVEIEPTRPAGGKIVWEWHVWDHLIQDRYPSQANYGTIAEHPESIDVNCNGRRVPAFWNHMNSIAYNERLDQIVLSVRGCNEIWIVDHSTTTKQAASYTGGRYGKGGGLLYRWGNPAAYKRGDNRDRQLFQQHDAQWIPDGCPGAGNILIFNNGLERGYSSIEEIAPPVDANGNYEIVRGRAYGPTKPIWNYTAANRADFFSSEISGAHRLPNGNTLICAGVMGTFFEVTPAGETVWKYVNPVVRGGTLAQGETPGVDDRGHYLNAVFKVHRYPPDYPGFAGQDLSPRGAIELPESMKGKTGLDGVNTSPARGRRRSARNRDDESERESVLRAIGYF